MAKRKETKKKVEKPVEKPAEIKPNTIRRVVTPGKKRFG